MAEKTVSDAETRSQMRAEGRQIYASLMRGDRHEIKVEMVRKGADVTQSQNFRYLNLEEIKYSVGEDRNNTWIRVAAPGGVRVIPIIRDPEGEKIIMAFMPRPAIERWTLEFVAGYVKPAETYDEAAAREVLEETGYAAGSLKKIATLANLPTRAGWIDGMFVAENLMFRGKKVAEVEEQPIKIITLAIPELQSLVDENKIVDVATVATFYTYLRSRSKLGALKRE